MINLPRRSVRWGGGVILRGVGGGIPLPENIKDTLVNASNVLGLGGGAMFTGRFNNSRIANIYGSVDVVGSLPSMSASTLHLYPKFPPRPET